MTKYEKLSLIEFGKRHLNFQFEDFKLIQKIKRMQKKHQLLCVTQASTGNNHSLMKKLQKEIRDKLPLNYSVEFLSDPKIYTVKLIYEGDMINWSLF